MKKFTNKLIKTLPYITIAILIGVTVTYAAPSSKLTPPSSISNTMYSLTDIFNLSTGQDATSGAGEIETTPALTETGKTLTEVYTAIYDEVAKLTPSVLLSGNTIFGVEGEATAGAPTVTFASADQTTYTCEALEVDSTQPAVTLETICGYHIDDGCSWSGSACIGGTKTPANGYMTWYAGKASCSASTEDGQTAGIWHLSTNIELLTHYMDNNDTGNPPIGFTSGYYWSGSTPKYSGGEGLSYGVGMSNGEINGGAKDLPVNSVHCAH